jgi:hypothetical protein
MADFPTNESGSQEPGERFLEDDGQGGLRVTEAPRTAFGAADPAYVPLSEDPDFDQVIDEPVHRQVQEDFENFDPGYDPSVPYGGEDPRTCSLQGTSPR